MVEIEIDGKKLKVAEGSTIIEAADDAGIYIPRFCYHKKLSIAANCRMCLVEVEKVGKPLPACATPITDGMVILTRSEKARDAQRAVMEFLLINHPLDCPICDQGGECELQDLSMGYGKADSNYCEPKRSVRSENIGPLVETWMTRCIHCTRCVRFGEEIAGMREMGVTFRGEHAEIGTYVKQFLRSELSGNIIDLCPVGALTNKPARYTGRGWEYLEHASVSPHDAVGSNLFVHSRGRALKPQRHVMRTVPRENPRINETWISDRDRYSVHGLYDESRITKPRIKQNGTWIEVDWQRAIDEIADKTRGLVAQRGADNLAALASPNSTVEELYLLQKLIRALGSNNVDHRLRQQDFSDQEAMASSPKMALDFEAIESLDAVLLIGSELRYEQPMLNHRINKAVAEGGEAMVVNPMDYSFNYPLTEKIITPSTQLPQALASIAKALAEKKNSSLDGFKDVTPCDHSRAIAEKLLSAEKSALFLGEHSETHPQAALIRQLAHKIAELSDSSVTMLTSGGNAAGAWLAGCVPHRGSAGSTIDKPGLNAKQLLSSDPVRGYFLLNTEPEFDSAFSYDALKSLELAGLVVCLTPFVTEAMESYADFILPVAPFTETPGTQINGVGDWQSFSAVSVPHGDAKPAWKVLRVLANFMELDGFDYKSVHEVQAEIKHAVEAMNQSDYAPAQISTFSSTESQTLHRLAPWPMYRCDALVRRSAPLQETISEETYKISINSKMAQQLDLKHGERVSAVQNGSRVILPLVIDDRLPNNTVLLPSGLSQTVGFGSAEQAISLERGQ